MEYKIKGETTYEVFQIENLDETELKIINLYLQGKTIEEIEKQIQPIPSKLIRKIRQIELENKVMELYKEGNCVKQIAENVGKSTNKVYEILSKLKKKGKIQKIKKSINQVEVEKLYNEEKTIEEIATIIKTTTNKINQTIKKLEEQKKIIVLYNEGKDKKEIAQELGKGISTIEAEMKKLIKEGRIEKRKKYSDIDIEIMILYDEGNNYKQILEKLGKLSESTIYEKIQAFRTQGLLGEPEIDRSKDEKVVSLYEIIKDNKIVAKELKISPVMVSSILKRNKEEGIILSIINQNSDIKANFEKIKSLIIDLKEQRKTTYEGIKSKNVNIQKEAILRKKYRKVYNRFKKIYKVSF